MIINRDENGRFIKGHGILGGEFIKGHKLSKESINKMRETKRKNKKIPWNKGLKMDDEFCKKASKRQKGIIPSKENRNKRSKSMIGRIPKNAGHKGIQSHYNSPFQKQIRLRSSYELAYAKYLDSINEPWYYEFKTFLIGNSSYTPDFLLPALNKYVEIKGYMSPDAQNKINLFYKLYPNINLEILYKKDLKNLGAFK